MSCTIQDHKWTLAIDEGNWSVSTPTCGPECQFLVAGLEPCIGTLGDEREWAHMEPIAVTVAMATECPAYPTDDDQVPTGPARQMGGYESGGHWIAHGSHCDCNWWPVIRPLFSSVSKGHSSEGASMTHPIDKVRAAALRSILASSFGNDEDPYADAHAELQDEELCIAARDLVRWVDTQSKDQQPVGWRLS